MPRQKPDKSQAEWIALRDKYRPREDNAKIYVPYSQVTDHPFEPWDRDNEVCTHGACGRLRADHADQTKIGDVPRTSDFGKQYWAWLLRHGGVFSIYGPSSTPTLLILEHLETCELRDDLAEPSMGEMDEFAGTDTGNAQVAAVIGLLQCKCGQATKFCDWRDNLHKTWQEGKFETVEWAVKHDGLTLGQVIFQVINEL